MQLLQGAFKLNPSSWRTRHCENKPCQETMSPSIQFPRVVLGRRKDRPWPGSSRPWPTVLSFFGICSVLHSQSTFTDRLPSLCECLLHERTELDRKWHQGWEVTDLKKRGLLAPSPQHCVRWCWRIRASRGDMVLLSSGSVPHVCNSACL